MAKVGRASLRKVCVEFAITLLTKGVFQGTMGLSWTSFSCIPPRIRPGPPLGLVHFKAQCNAASDSIWYGPLQPLNLYRNSDLIDWKPEATLPRQGLSVLGSDGPCLFGRLTQLARPSGLKYDKEQDYPHRR